MSDEEAYYIPMYLDEPEKLLFWSFDEAIMLLAPLVLGIVIGHIMMSLAFSTALYFSWKKLKGTEQANLAVYSFYWFFPVGITGLKASPPSYIRTYLG